MEDKTDEVTRNKKNTAVLLLVLAGIAVGFITGYSMNLNEQVDKEIEYRLERALYE